MKGEKKQELRPIDTPEFTWDEIEYARQNYKLLTFGMELSNLCNFHCLYCYRNAGKPLQNELTLEELYDAAKQAIDLRAKKVGIVGAGEPTLDSRLIPLLKFLRKYLKKVSVFTNGSCITPELAQELANLKIKIVLKINSLNPKAHNTLVGRRDGYKLTMQGLKNLIDAGYQHSNITVESVITRINLKDLPSLWRWCRENGFTPFFERLTPQGRAISSNLHVSPFEVFKLFRKLKEIDEKYYGFTWRIQPPWAPYHCLRHYYNCLIDIQGNVLPCSGVDIIVGNIREKPLSEILKTSPVIRNLRFINQKIKGKCSQCNYKPWCYGCRAAAYHLTGDYLAEDPLCWHSFHSNLEESDINEKKVKNR